MRNNMEKERSDRKAMHMAQLFRVSMGMENEEDIRAWSEKFEEANPVENYQN